MLNSQKTVPFFDSQIEFIHRFIYPGLIVIHMIRRLNIKVLHIVIHRFSEVIHRINLTDIF